MNSRAVAKRAAQTADKADGRQRRPCYHGPVMAAMRMGAGSI